MLIGALSLVIVVWRRDLDELLAQVDAHRAIDDRDQEHDTGTLDQLQSRLAEAEHDESVVLGDHADGQECEHQQDDDQQDDTGDRDRIHEIQTLPSW